MTLRSLLFHSQVLTLQGKLGKFEFHKSLKVIRYCFR